MAFSIANIVSAPLPIPLAIVIVVVLAFIMVVAYAFFMTMFMIQIPNWMAHIKSQMKRKAIVLMHYSNRKAEYFCPEREGKKKHKNTLTFPQALGTKFDASGQGLEEVVGKSIMYNYYSKSCHPMPAEQVKAVSDFRAFCGSRGIPINEELIDVLFVEDLDILDVYTQPLLEKVLKNLPLPIRTQEEGLLDENTLVSQSNKITAFMEAIEEKYANEEPFTVDDANLYEKLTADLNIINSRIGELNVLKKHKEDLTDTLEQIDALKYKKKELIENIDIITGYLDPDTRQTIYTLSRMKEDLQKRVIRDGAYVYPKVHEFVFAASALNSAGMTEAISIAEADAMMQNRQDQNGWTMPMVMMAIVGLIVLFAGIGVGYKIAFG